MAETSVELAEGHITEEMLEEMRGYTGVKLRIAHAISNEEATKVAITKFANGIGDGNPLWNDEEYAVGTRYGNIVAPPSWIFSVFAGVQYGWRGLSGFHNASSIDFFLPILRNDKIAPEMICTGFDGPKESRFAKKMVVELNETYYRNQRNELVAKNTWQVTHTERAEARKTGKYHNIQLPHPWTEEELKKVEEEVLAEERSGPSTPCWDDVEVGQELKPVIKGPLTLSDEIAYLIGGGAPIPRIMAHGLALKFYRRHPKWAFRDPNSYGLEPNYAVHYNKAAALAQGLPYQYDVGYQRHAWQIHLLTNYAGDEGWVKNSSCQYRRFVYFSDVVRLTGTIVEKFVDEDGECCVKIETHAMNQRGEDAMPGHAIIALPSVKKGFAPLDGRLKKE